jgi:hypothetical protein
MSKKIFSNRFGQCEFVFKNVNNIYSCYHVHVATKLSKLEQCSNCKMITMVNTNDQISY